MPGPRMPPPLPVAPNVTSAEEPSPGQVWAPCTGPHANLCQMGTRLGGWPPKKTSQERRDLNTVLGTTICASP